MIIRIFGITNPTGHFLYNRILKKKYKNIICYSRGNANYSNIDISKKSPVELIKKDNYDEIWISFCPIWILNKYLTTLINCNKHKKYKIRRIITCSSSSKITKKYSWNKYDKSLIEKISFAENNLIKISKKNNIHLSIIRPTMIFGNSGEFKDNNINKITSISKISPIIFLPKESGERQPIHISQLAKIIDNEISLEKYQKRLNLINVGGDETLTYENLVRNILKKKKINSILFVIKTELFFFIISPILLINPRLYSEIMRICSNLSGFTESHILLKNNKEKFIDFI